MSRLTNKQRIFIDEYLQCWNATEAARRAGYSERTASIIGFENLRKPNIAEAIERRLSEKQMAADEVLTRLADMARGDVKDFIRMTDLGPEIDLERAIAENKSHLIKKLKYNSQGLPEIELYDAQAALQLIGKHHGLFIDKQEFTFENVIPVTIVEVAEPDSEDDG